MADYQDNPKRQFAKAWHSATDALDEWRKQVTAATSEALDKLDPAVRSAMEAHGHWQAPQCPCASAHPQDQGVCDGRAIMTRQLRGTSMPICAPCAVAQGVAEMRH